MTDQNGFDHFDEQEAAGTVPIPSTTELLSLLPYLLGFQPSNSLVVFGYDQDQPREAVTIRVDLPEASVEAQNEAAERLTTQLCSAIPSEKTYIVILIGYGTSEAVTPFGSVVESLLTHKSITVGNFLRVQDNRYWSYTCTDSTCCQPEGTPFQPQTSAAAAEAVLAGRSVAKSRDALRSTLEPLTGEAGQRAQRALGRASAQAIIAGHGISAAAYELEVIGEGLALVIAIGDRVRAGERIDAFDEDEIAKLIVLLCHRYVRDHALADVIDDPRRFLAFWREVLRRCDAASAPGPACLTAYAALLLGDGPLADMALERADEADDGNFMVFLLKECSSNMVSPSQLPRITHLELVEANQEYLDRLRRDAGR